MMGGGQEVENGMEELMTSYDQMGLVEAASDNSLIVIAGAGGFIGGHLARELISLGYDKISIV